MPRAWPSVSAHARWLPRVGQVARVAGPEASVARATCPTRGDPHAGAGHRSPRIDAVSAERILRLSPTYALEHCVPVTARLSKRFYDVLGEDVANEFVDWFNAVDLTYRADLREAPASSITPVSRRSWSSVSRSCAPSSPNSGTCAPVCGRRSRTCEPTCARRSPGYVPRSGTELQEVGTEVHQGNTALERVRGELLRRNSASGSPPSSGLPAC